MVTARMANGGRAVAAAQSSSRRDDDRIFDAFKRTLIGWPYYAQTARQERRAFADGGGIERRTIPTEAGFCGPVSTYADLSFCWLRVRATLGDLCGAIVLEYWGYQWTYNRIESAHRIGSDTVTAWLWEGTKRLAEYYTRLPDARQRVDAWKEERRGKSRDFI